MKIMLISLAIGIFVLFIVPMLYNFLFLGQRDFGLSYDYQYCRDGIYSTYPNGVFDGSSTYYDKENNEIGVCNSWVPGPTCPSSEIKNTCHDKGLDVPLIRMRNPISAIF